MPATITEPSTYTPHLDQLQTEEAVAWIKRFFPDTLSEKLDLQQVCAPIIVDSTTGLNDDLNGVEQPVSLTSKDGIQAEVVQSLAKWKRWRLHELGIPAGKGLFANMRALRPDEATSPMHSIYVDQWDWEKHITREQRTRAFLEETVEKLYATFRDTEAALAERYPEISPVLPESVTFVHTEELLRMYPDRSPAEREEAFCKEHGAIFVIGIGAPLSDGEKHEGRAPDYDDWTTKAEDGQAGLNGDLVLWMPALGEAVEVSSMGIRVDEKALERQLEMEDCTERMELPFHQALKASDLPLSIGGGIGQSRVCLFLLRKAHVGEVQASVWSDETRAACKEQGIPLMGS